MQEPRRNRTRPTIQRSRPCPLDTVRPSPPLLLDGVTGTYRNDPVLSVLAPDRGDLDVSPMSLGYSEDPPSLGYSGDLSSLGYSDDSADLGYRRIRDGPGTPPGSAPALLGPAANVRSPAGLVPWPAASASQAGISACPRRSVRCPIRRPETGGTHGPEPNPEADGPQAHR